MYEPIYWSPIRYFSGLTERNGKRNLPTIVVMASKLLALGLLVFSGTLSAGGLSLSIGVGSNTNLTGASIPWDDGNGVGAYLQLEYERPINSSFSLVGHWVHLSQWDIGPPFNDDSESSVDYFGVAIKWKIF